MKRSVDRRETYLEALRTPMRKPSRGTGFLLLVREHLHAHGLAHFTQRQQQPWREAPRQVHFTTINVAF